MRMTLLIGFLWLAFAGLANAAKVAEYSFQNNYQSSVGGAPDLINYGLVAFDNEVVYGEDRTVLTFTVHSGVVLSLFRSLLSNPNVYTIAILARFDTEGRWNKILDFSNLSFNDGLYTKNGGLIFYPYLGGEETPIDQAYHAIVLTRNITGVLTGYVDGVHQFTQDDSIYKAGITSPADQLHIFVDEDDVEEAEVGAVAGIRIWNTSLDASEVAAIVWDRIFANGFELTP